MKMQVDVVGYGAPVVLVPGGLTGWLSWEPHAKILSSRREVVRVQLLSVQLGLEGVLLPSDYSIQMESQALVSTLDSLGYTMPLDLVGWSFGALTTLDFALTFPGRVRSLTLIEPPAFWVLRSRGAMSEEMQHLMEVFDSFKGDISEDQLATFLQNAGFVGPGQSVRGSSQWNLWVRHRNSLRNSPAVVHHADDVRRLRSFEAPTLLVKGTGSAAFLHDIIDDLSVELPQSRIMELPSGHAPHILSRDRFLVEMEQFQRSAAWRLLVAAAG
jgi:pimeloyl-ACP methyl ester carboxylesterase